MDETKEILTNDEVVETVEGVVEAIPDTNENNLGIGLLIGAAVTSIGVLATKYLIVPGAKKISNKIKELKAKKAEDTAEDNTSEDFDE